MIYTGNTRNICDNVSKEIWMALYAFWLHPCSLHAQHGTNKSLNKTTPPIFSFSRGVCYSNPTLLCARDLSVKAQGDPISRSVSERVEPRRRLSLNYSRRNERTTFTLVNTVMQFPFSFRETSSSHDFSSSFRFLRSLWWIVCSSVGTPSSDNNWNYDAFQISKWQDLWCVLRYFQLGFWWIMTYACIKILLRVLNFEFEIEFVIYILFAFLQIICNWIFGEFITRIYIEYCLRIFRLFVLGESIERNHVGSLHILGNRREIGSVYNFQYVASLRMQQNKTNVRLYDDLWQSTELLQSVGSKIALKNSENSESFLIYRPIMHPSWILVIILLVILRDGQI